MEYYTKYYHFWHRKHMEFVQEQCPPLSPSLPLLRSVRAINLVLVPAISFSTYYIVQYVTFPNHDKSTESLIIKKKSLRENRS